MRGLRFSRNFGKEAAIFAGLAAAEGDCCAVIDCDLQHPPEKLVEILTLLCDPDLEKLRRFLREQVTV